MTDGVHVALGEDFPTPRVDTLMWPFADFHTANDTRVLRCGHPTRLEVDHPC